MNVHFSYKIEKTTDLENLLQQQTYKLNRLFQVFRPELVLLKGSVVESTASRGPIVALNLRLASGQMAAPTALPVRDPLKDELVEYPKSA